MIKICRNPVPKVKTGRKSVYEKVVKQMKVGDSVVFSGQRARNKALGFRLCAIRLGYAVSISKESCGYRALLIK